MFTHVMVGSNDLPRSKSFYDAVLGALGVPAGYDGGTRIFYSGCSGGAFAVGTPINGEAASHANGGTIGFGASDKEAVDAFHAAGLANGGSCDGGPGLRASPSGKAYGAYLRDPDGNKLCAFTQLKD